MTKTIRKTCIKILTQTKSTFSMLMKGAILNHVRNDCFVFCVQEMRCGNFIVKKPMVIGHECAGIIEEVGSQVRSPVAGERVALEPGISCRLCQLCKEGQYNLCRNMKFFGSPPTNGCLANLVLKLNTSKIFNLVDLLIYNNIWNSREVIYLCSIVCNFFFESRNLCLLDHNGRDCLKNNK